MRTVIGIDPGLAATGWGVVRFDGSRFFHVGHGVVHTDSQASLSARLLNIHGDIRKLLRQVRPDGGRRGGAVFLQERLQRDAGGSRPRRGAPCSRPEGDPRGVLLPAACQSRRSSAGGGQTRTRCSASWAWCWASKRCPRPDHAADALAVAICHANRSQVNVQQRHR